MSYVQASSAHPGFVSPAITPKTSSDIEFNLVKAIRVWWLQYKTASQLNALSDAMLADIGVERSAIDSIARQVAIRAHG